MARRQTQTGSTAVEFALVMRVFLTFFLGLLDLTRLLYTWQAAAEAARVGARYAAVCDDTTRSADVRALMQRTLPALTQVAIDWLPAGCAASQCQSLRLRVTGLQFQWISPIAGINALAPIALPVASVELTREAMRQDPQSTALCTL
jgi:hypothetical protein